MPRYVTQESEQHSDTIVRRGLAFIIEHGFWKSELGKQHYFMVCNFATFTPLLRCICNKD